MTLTNIISRSPYFVRLIGVNIYGYILSRKRFSGNFSKYYDTYYNNLEKTPKEVDEEQFSLLQKNLINCAENIPYYKRIFSEVGFDPYEMKSVHEIAKLPFLTKDIIRKEKENLINSKTPKKKFKHHSTSGSTGEKLQFLVPKELFHKKNTAFLYRFYKMAGVQPMDKRVTIGGRNFTKKPPYWLRNYFENQLLLSSHHLKNETVPIYLEKIAKFQPRFIQGHPSSILVLAKYVLARNLELGFSLKVIFTTGETLIESDRKTIEEAFNCKVLQQYGSGENCFSTQESPDQDGYLINYEHGFIELIGDGDYKEVVVTSLQNDVMPFVRYRMGDFVTAVDKKYSQKYGLPILFKEVLGRVDDLIEDYNGQTILPVTIRMNIKPLIVEGTNYQLIQNEKGSFTIKLVDPKLKLSEKRIIAVLKKILGEKINISTEFVESLTSAGGKIRNIQKLK